jgi:hypothetical protein
MLDRLKIIGELVGAVEPLPEAHAMWEGGAAAFGRLDTWSDIDMCVVADDLSVDAIFAAVEKALEALSPFEKLAPIGAQDGYKQAFYRLERASPFHLIDLAVFKLSAPDKFLAPQIHGKAVFFFNKEGKIKIPDLDRATQKDQIEARFERLGMRHRFFNNFVEKEICRENWLEAMDYYQSITLATLVELLRIRHYPYHHQFKMRYIHQELPSDVIGRLQPLFFVGNSDDLKQKYTRATGWIEEILSNGASPPL